MNHLIVKAYKVRLYPTHNQKVLIEKTFGCTRFVYNYFLDQSIKKYQTDGTSSTYNQNSKQLTELKKQLLWLREVDSDALQYSLRNLNTAYENFFRRVKSGSVPGFPKFKKKSSSASYHSCRAGSTDFCIKNNRIKLRKLGYVKFHGYKHIPGDIMSVTVSKSASGEYYCSILCNNIAITSIESARAPVGIDLGLKDFLVTSDGEKVENPKFLHESERKLMKLQRRYSRTLPGSKNREKARILLAKQHEKVSNQRNDFLHKLSTDIIKNHDTICIENLQVNNMVKNNKLAKAISDVSWSKFVAYLSYKAQWYNRQLIKIDTFFPSSQLCSCCGYKNTAVTDLSIRQWSCPNCSTIHDRDINAAINILNEGLKLATV